MKHLTVLPALCVLAACAAVPIEQPAPASSFARLPLDEFPGALKVLSGFDERAVAPDWVPHDQVLFALRLDKAGDVKRWLLHLDAQAEVPVSSMSPGSTVANPDGSASVSMQSLSGVTVVKVFEADGVLLDETTVALPASYLSQGLLPSIRAHTVDEAQDRGTIEAAEALRLWMQGYFTMEALLSVVRENDVLASYFWQVVETPGVWSVITHLGASPSVHLSFEKSVAASAPEPLRSDAGAFSVPLRVDVNGTAALFVDLLAGEASRPYALCGGIVAATARHPTRRDVKFSMQLIAARRGR
ncbi:MAG TPA: hypothetical protein VF384_15715 [Planctomycetota bacterium]